MEYVDRSSTNFPKAKIVSFTILQARFSLVVPCMRPMEYVNGGHICKPACADTIEIYMVLNNPEIRKAMKLRWLSAPTQFPICQSKGLPNSYWTRIKIKEV
ncbi:protein S-acyltransferase [Trifolium repens]|nr:protein S-acyltransferase [Trifolium repens]